MNPCDHLLWCHDCGISKKGECHEHGDLFRIKDRIIPSRARLTVPYCLAVKELELRVGEKHVYGVFAKKVIQKRTQFGPFEGDMVSQLDDAVQHAIIFKVFNGDHYIYLNNQDESRCNWMMFVRPANNAEEQNMVAYQFRGHIYYTTIKAIPPGGELKVWYAPDYSNQMNPPEDPVCEHNGDIQVAQTNHDITHDTEYLDNSAELDPDHDPADADSEDFTCSACGDYFPTLELLDDHICKVDGGRRTRNKRKGQPQKLGTRLRTSNGKFNGSAKTHITRGRKTKLLKVKKRVTEKTLFQCPCCDKVFASENKLQLHQYTHTGEKPFKCSYEGCTKEFASKFKLFRHEGIHSGDKQHKCIYCEKGFTRKDHLKNHLKIHDNNRELMKCQFCEKEYSTSYAFKTHLAFHMAEAGDLTCRVCAKEFDNKDVLVYHIKVHAGARSVKGASDKKCKCPHCEKCFFTMKDVRRHLVVHTRARNFLCQFCPQSFGRRDHLTRHLKKNHPHENPAKIEPALKEDLISQAAAAASLVRPDDHEKNMESDINKEPLVHHEPQGLPQSQPNLVPTIQYTVTNSLSDNFQTQPEQPFGTNYSVVTNQQRIVSLGSLIGLPANMQQVGLNQIPNPTMAELRSVNPLSKSAGKQYDLSPQTLTYIQTSSHVAQDSMMNPRYAPSMMTHPRDNLNPLSDTLHTVAMENLHRQHSLLPQSVQPESDRILIPTEATYPVLSDYMDAMKALSSYPGLPHNPFIPPPPASTPSSSLTNPIVDISGNIYTQAQSMPFR